MPRPPRTIKPDGIYHVLCRGNNRGTIAWDAHDFTSLFRELDKVACRWQWDVFSWCFMNNHYHVLVRTPFGGFSEGFQVINGTHSRRTNRRHGRRDHLFRNRPRCRPIRSEAHFVNALLYIARNPVAAGSCQSADEWSYGSYRALAGLVDPPAWLLVDDVHRLFGADRRSASLEYARLVSEGHLLVSDTKDELPPA